MHSLDAISASVTRTVDDLRLFLRIVETGSLREAAEEIRSDPSRVSRRLSALEAEVGAQLIRRSRARSSPTDAGRRYYDQLVSLLEELDALEADVSGSAEDPRGVLRVAAPIDFGASHVGPWLQELSAAHPRLSVDLRLSDAFVDFTEGGFDLLVRIGALDDSSLRARKLGIMPLVLVAAPRFEGVASHPAELAEQPFVLYSGMRTGLTLTLQSAEDEEVQVHCQSRFTVNNLGGAARVVEAGGGLHAGPLWYFAAALREGRMVRILPEWAPPPAPVHALFTPGNLPAKVRRAVDHLALRMADTEGVEAL